jgi:N-methylhydantoinase B
MLNLDFRQFGPRRTELAKLQINPLPMIDRGGGYEKMLRGEYRPRMP